MRQFEVRCDCSGVSPDFPERFARREPAIGIELATSAGRNRARGNSIRCRRHFTPDGSLEAGLDKEYSRAVRWVTVFPADEPNEFSDGVVRVQGKRMRTGSTVMNTLLLKRLDLCHH